MRCFRLPPLPLLVNEAIQLREEVNPRAVHLRFGDMQRPEMLSSHVMIERLPALGNLTPPYLIKSYGSHHARPLIVIPL